MSRIAPAQPPYAPGVEAQLARIMPKGVPPLLLFRVLARDERLFTRLFAAGLLDRGQLTLRTRELAILRVCGNCRSEYEWGVHVSMFADKAGLGPAQLRATLAPAPSEALSEPEQRVFALCDELCAGTEICDETWSALSKAFSEEARLELLLLIGFYRTICVLTNGLRLPLEPYAARFASHQPE